MDSCCDEAQYALKIQDAHASTSSSTFQLSAHHSLSFATNFEVKSVYISSKSFRFNDQFHDLKPPDRCIVFGQFRI
jgi:hypothetical protein